MNNLKNNKNKDLPVAAGASNRYATGNLPYK